MKRAFLMLLVWGGLAGAALAQSNALAWHGIFGGGRASASASGALQASIGQPVANGFSAAVVAGFWTRAYNASAVVIPPTNNAVFLGLTNLVEGPAGGTDTVSLFTTNATNSWSGSTAASWLHLAAGALSGAGSTNVAFSFDSNPGTTRSGSINWAGHTMTITQAGSAYVAVHPLTTLVSSGLYDPTSLAVDPAGNVIIWDYGHSTIKKWSASANTLTNLVFISGSPLQPAMDSAGNFYYCDRVNRSLMKWVAATAQTVTLVGGLSSPQGVAVDGAGNVFFSDAYSLKELVATNGSVLVFFSSLFSNPWFLGLDQAGNVYLSDWGNSTLEVWSAATHNISRLIASGLVYPAQMAVDGGGNVYVADTGDYTIKKWRAADGSLQVVANLSSSAYGVAVDAAENVYIGYTGNDALSEVPRALVNPAAVSLSAAAGSYGLPPVLPVTENLTGPFAPVVSAGGNGWLALTGVSSGVVAFNYSANSGVSRSATITVLGQSTPVTQSTLALASQPPATLAPSPAVLRGAYQFGITSIDLAGPTAVNLTLWGQPGSAYALQRSFDLAHWQAIWLTNAPDTGSFYYLDNFLAAPNQPAGTAFYRLMANSP